MPPYQNPVDFARVTLDISRSLMLPISPISLARAAAYKTEMERALQELLDHCGRLAAGAQLADIGARVRAGESRLAGLERKLDAIAETIRELP